MSFKVTILGSGAALPTSRRGPTSQYIECNGRHILIDCGEGTQNAIRKHQIHLQKITHILISHLHGDHYFGLVGLLSTMHLLGRDKGITIYGPKELEQIIKLQLEVGGARLNFSCDFVVTSTDKKNLLFEDKLIEIHSFPLVHRVPTTGFEIREKAKLKPLNSEKFKRHDIPVVYAQRLKEGVDVVLENGKTIKSEDYTFAPPPSATYCFCSDTKFDLKVVDFVKKTTVLYHEATFLHKLLDRANQTFHTTALQAAMIAKEAEVGKLLIGHLSSRYENGLEHQEEAKSVFDNTLVVEDGDVYNV